MEYALLIGVVVLLAAMALYGYSRGFIRIALSMVAMIATIILATILTIPVSGIIRESAIGENIRKSVAEMVQSADVIDTDTISNLDFPEAMLKPVQKGAESTKEAIDVYVTDALTESIIHSLTFLVLTVVIYIIIRIIIFALNIVSKLPLINGANKLAGMVVGLIQGLLIVWIACLIIAACSDKAWAQEAFRQINDNGFLKFIYNNNFIIWITASLL